MCTVLPLTPLLPVHPVVKVHEQIVATRLGSEVRMSCMVEAAPASVNYWIKRAVSLQEMGERLRDNSARLFDFFVLGRNPSFLPLFFPPDRNVNPSRRYRPMEIKESLYTVVMTLIIRDVRPDDIRNYTCVARNSKGSAKGTIALQRE